MLSKRIMGMIVGEAFASNVHAQCGPESSDCYVVSRYNYGGGIYCHRFSSGSYLLYGVLGSITETPIGNATINQTVFDAYGTWYDDTSFPVFIESAGTERLRR